MDATATPRRATDGGEPSPAGAAVPGPQHWPGLLALGGGISLSVLLFLLVQQSEQTRLESDFLRWAHSRRATVQRALDEHLNILNYLGSLYFSSFHVDREEFARFAKDNLARLPAIRSLEWIPVIPATERPRHEAEIRAGGYPGYRIFERDGDGDSQTASPQSVYYPVLYVLPQEKERTRLGWNLGSVTEYAEAMTRAVGETNSPILTRVSRVNPAVPQAPDWRAFLAVYTNGVDHYTPAQRHDNLAGFLAAELSLKSLLDGALRHPLMARPARVEVGDLAVQVQEASFPSKVVYQSPNWPAAAEVSQEVTHSFTLETGGRTWRLVFRATPEYLAGKRGVQAWILLGASLLLSGLVSAFLFSMAGREAKVNRLVWKRTADLSRANADLKVQIRQRETAEQELEEERYLLEALMGTTPDHIYFKDRNSRFLRVSKAQAERFKVTEPAAVAGKTDFDFFTSEHAQRAFHDEQEIMRTGQPMVGREEKETWPDGSVSWVSTTKQCLRDQQGHVMGTFGISRDITAHKQAEAALARKTAELERSNQELEQFAYVASHDLQEPLRMIASYTQLLARRYRGKLDTDADEFIGYAVDGAARMQTLINDLLTYSRVDRKGKPLAPTDTGAALERALDNLKVAIEDAGAIIHRGALPQVMADDVQLTQLFQNLISNALKYRSQAPPEIRIAATLKNGDAGPEPVPGRAEWVFTVQDNGIGIEAEYFERIFVIFQRLHTREEYPGTGIGLSVCKKIVERHGGRIWVESQPGRGCTFAFTMPKANR